MANPLKNSGDAVLVVYTPLVCIALCIFQYRALQRFVPRMLRVMVGERK